MATERRVELTKVQGLISASRQLVVDFCIKNWGSRISPDFKVKNFKSHWANIHHCLKISTCNKKHRLVHLALIADMAQHLDNIIALFESHPFDCDRHTRLLSQAIEHYLRQMGVLRSTSQNKMVTFTINGKPIEVKGLLGPKNASSLAKSVKKNIVEGFDSNMLITEVSSYGQSVKNALMGTADIDITQLPVIPRACAFKGGGMMGLAYIGAIRAMQRLGLLSHIRAVAGTSGGALSAACLAFGMNDVDMEQTLLSFTPDNVIRPVTPKKPMRVFAVAANVVRRCSLFKDDKLRQYLSHIVHNATGEQHITFLQLHEMVLAQDRETGSENKQYRYRDLIIIGTNGTDRMRLEFSWRTHPHLRIDDALRISVSIPGYFPEVRAVVNEQGAFILREDGSIQIKITDSDQHVVNLCDGGVMLNYPLHAWDTDIERQDVVGFYLQDNYVAGHRVPQMALMRRVASSMLRAAERPTDNQRSVIIPATRGLNATTWKFSKQTMMKAEHQGFVSTIGFFKEKIRQAQIGPKTALLHDAHSRYEQGYLLILEKFCQYATAIYMDPHVVGRPTTVQLLFDYDHADSAKKVAEAYYMLTFMVNPFYFGSCQAGHFISCMLRTTQITQDHVQWIRQHGLNQVAEPFVFNDLRQEPLNFEELDKYKMAL